MPLDTANVEGVLALLPPCVSTAFKLPSDNPDELCLPKGLSVAKLFVGVSSIWSEAPIFFSVKSLPLPDTSSPKLPESAKSR